MSASGRHPGCRGEGGSATRTNAIELGGGPRPQCIELLLAERSEVHRIGLECRSFHGCLLHCDWSGSGHRPRPNGSIGGLGAPQPKLSLQA